MKTKEYIIWAKIVFRGGQREPALERYEVMARTKTEAIGKAKKWLLNNTEFEVEKVNP
jgi:hypothetical protein